MADKIEKMGGLTFRNDYLVASFDAKAELERRGGIDKMLKESLKHNALLQKLAKESR